MRQQQDGFPSGLFLVVFVLSYNLRRCYIRNMGRHRLHVALIYNACRGAAPEMPDDHGSTDELRKFVRHLARVIRKLGHRVTLLPLANDLMGFQRRLTRLRPDVVFNQYDDVVHGALYEMRVAALVRMMGFPMTGSSALALGLCLSLIHISEPTRPY